jgi:hypothetical protein
MQVGTTTLDLPMPVHMTMPIDELHRRAEELEYSEILDKVPASYHVSAEAPCSCHQFNKAVAEMLSTPDKAPDLVPCLT